MKKYYLAYGSNLNLTQMHMRCSNAVLLGTTILKGYRLVFKGENHGYLTIEKCINKSVPLGIFEISDMDEKKLDIYEGYPIFYDKQYFKIKINGEKVNAIIYVMNKEFDYALPTKEYLARCVVGYYDVDFDVNILKNALEETKYNMANSYTKRLKNSVEINQDE